MYNTVVIPAAGMGSRMNTRENKLFIKLDGKPILYHTLKTFIENSFIEEIIIVIQENEIEYCQKNIIDLFESKKNIKIVVGGKTRKDSVFNGIKAACAKTDNIIIHDGARPLITNDIINNVLGTLESEVAVTTGVNVKDTIKIKDHNDYIVKTVNRNNLTSIQTPQGFKYELIKKAHQEKTFDKTITDDAYLVELMNQKVKIIEGSYENIKVTTPIDITVAEEILRSRRV